MIWRAEVWVYDAIRQLGVLEVSTVSGTGPWTDLQLTEPRTLRGAAVEWLSLAIAAGVPMSGFVLLTGPVRFVISASGAMWVRLSETQADLFGFSTQVLNLATPQTSDLQPLGLQDVLGLSVYPPAFRGQARLNEYRGGRARSHHYARSVVHQIEAHLTAEQAALLEHGPLFRAGRQRLACGDPATAYAATALDGFLDLYIPAQEIEVAQVEGSPEGDDVLIRLYGVEAA